MKDFFSRKWVLAVLTGLMLIPGWYEWGSGLTLLIAFIPLLILMEHFVGDNRGGRKIFLLSGLSFLVWNLGATWWVYNAALIGLVMAFYEYCCLVKL
jgi:apolipoprotein N-acyltransferase